MKHIGVLTSGGDCPGMNAAVRAVVRSACFHGIAVTGVKRGYAGLVAGDLVPMGLSSVSGIICRGGTVLGTARCDEFKTEQGQQKAEQELKKAGVEGLIVIGGDGSFKGADVLSSRGSVATVGMPASIDNDIAGSDYSIGFDTAVNTAMEAIDRIRDTAVAHDRLFFVEVMGRKAGFIALMAALAGGAEEVLLPELVTDLDAVTARLEAGRKRGKTSSIVVVAEGDDAGDAFRISREIRERIGYDFRVTVLGHIQRGGAPTVRDRVVASRLGAEAVDVLREGESGLMVGMDGDRVVRRSLRDSTTGERTIEKELYELVLKLAT